MPRGVLRANVPADCTVCAATFQAKTTGQKYCSPRCKNRGGAQLRKARNQERPERRCYRCGETRPATSFTSATKTYCADCDRTYARGWRSQDPVRIAVYKRRSIAKAAAADPEYYRKLTLRKFGLTPAAFAALVERSGGRCAICSTADPGGKHDTWHVDHDHRCCPRGRSCGSCIRGILCSNCNLGLGHFKDNAAILQSAMEYLAAHA